MVGERDHSVSLDACRQCGRESRFLVDGTLQSWRCTNCGTNNVVDGYGSRDATRIPVSEADESPHGDDPSIH